jgi:hypothetical protein
MLKQNAGKFSKSVTITTEINVDAGAVIYEMYSEVHIKFVSFVSSLNRNSKTSTNVIKKNQNYN